MSSRKRSRETQRGYSSPLEEPPVEVPRPPTTPRDLGESRPSIPLAAPTPAAAEPDLELEEIFERGSPGLLGDPWCAVEVWTQNRLYGLDGALICRIVRDRRTNATQGDHPVVGARLLGGQRRDPSGRITHVAHPFPRRGMAAVFATGMGSRLRVSETSSVTRVVVRQRVVEVGADTPPPPWDAIVG
ncbi:MAG: hypothetical protein H6722_06845 [Sandaracinus sp.]|nr:hypothetical protein [Myxococcales bacterium]MCB9612154.1 hypothetical protein [Sandaracinus sp.]